MRITRQSLGIAGAVILALGVFAPIVRLPIVGSIDYFRNGEGRGAFVLVFAVIAAVLTFMKKYRLVLVPAGLSLILIGYDFVDLQSRLHRAREALDRAGNMFRPLRELGALAAQTIQLQWGWVAMLTGVALLAAAALVKEETPAPASVEGSGAAPAAPASGE